MSITILGFGYVAKACMHDAVFAMQTTHVYSRHTASNETTANFTLTDLDKTSANPIVAKDCLLYTVPPPATGEQDTRVTQLIHQLTTPPQHIIYLGTSGVYGDCQGNWVHEQHPVQAQFPRHRRRLHAEMQLRAYCEQHGCQLSLLRIAGIYGPGRLPLTAVKAKQAIVHPQQAPWTNHIHIDDLVTTIKACIAQPKSFAVYNVADGNPAPMGTLQSTLAKILQLSAPPTESLSQALATASPMRSEFLQASRRLCIAKLQQALGFKIQYSYLEQGLRASL